MQHEICEITPHGVAHRHGVCVGDCLLTINDEPIIDEIDYQALSAGAHISMRLQTKEGQIKTLAIRKQEGEALGIRFGESMLLSPRTCYNNCAFCFIDQMPPSMRDTLYVKDDDWRYSLMMGNFVTLTNVNEKEFQRIIDRKASPLYISVHATESKTRCKLMNNRFAGDILDKLKRLADADIFFHCQIVLCPGYNDGEVLMQTLSDLRKLAPHAQSVAMVPVGLTRFREKLAHLTPFNKEGARALLAMLAPFQAECRKTIGTTFAFPSDEFFCIAKASIPSDEWYEDYAQIENGVGMLRLFQSAMQEAKDFDDQAQTPTPKHWLIPTGTSVAPFLQKLCDTYAPTGTKVTVFPVKNRFFGETVTVAGLLTGQDVLEALHAFPKADATDILLCRVMLRHEGDLFLDDLHIDEFCKRAPLPVHLVDNDGQALYDALQGRVSQTT